MSRASLTALPLTSLITLRSFLAVIFISVCFAIKSNEPKVSIVPVEVNEEGFTISKIILTKTVKRADLSEPAVSAKMDSYNVKDIIYKSSQAKIVGEYEEESDIKFTSIIVSKKK